LFDDEFNGNSLDTMKWNYNYPWSQHGLADDSVEQPSQVTVGNGVMTLTAIQSGQWYNGTYYNYTSGAVNTEGKLNFTYGYIESSQEMSGQTGTWPAFWMLQNGWPPEIDIQEVPEFYWGETSYPLTYHFNPAGGGSATSVGTTVNTGINLSTSFNTYGVDWEPNSLTFYFNGNEVYSVTGSQANIAQAAGMYLLIDLGVGGWPGEPPAGTYFPATMQTDWVRVWQQSGAAESGWNQATGGSWDNSSSWNNGVPTLTSTLAYFGPQTGNPASIVIDWSGSRSINGITFDSKTNYSLGATPNDGAGLMISGTDGVPTAAETVSITQTAATTNGSTINARIEIPFSLLTLNVTNSSTAPITFAGDMIGPGNIAFLAGSAVIGGNDQMTGTTQISGSSKLTVTGQISATADLLISQGTVAISNGGSVVSTGYSSVGNLSGSLGTLTLNGSMSANGDFNVGDVSGATGVMTMGNGTALSAETLYIGKYGNANGTLIQADGSISTIAGGGDWRIGGGGSSADAAAVGVYNISAGTFNDTNNFQVGAYGTGTVHQTGGSVSVGATLSIGRFAGGVGLYDLSSGTGTLTVAAANLIVGEAGTGTLKVGGISVVNASGLSIGNDDGGIGLVQQTGGTLNASGGVVLGLTASGNKSSPVSGTYNLSGGLLVTQGISQSQVGNVTGVLNLNGGVIQANATGTNLITGLSSAYVQNGGAIFNTSSYSVSLSQPLLHSPGASTIDGGLTKIGSGTLSLVSQSSYTGATNISKGTLTLAPQQLPLAYYSFNSVVGSTVINSGTGGSALNGTLNGSGATIVSGGLNGNSALSLNGTASSMNINPLGLNFNGSGSWTVSAWIETSQAGSTLLYKGSGGWAYGNSIFFLGGSSGTGGSGGSATSVRYAGSFFSGANTNLSTGTWQMLTYTDNAGKGQIYVNGTPVGAAVSDPMGMVPDVGTLIAIGLGSIDPYDGTQNFKGLIDNLRIDNAGLTAAQVQQLYTTGSVTAANSANILPASSPVMIASGAVLNLNGVTQSIPSLSGPTGSSVTLGTGTLNFNNASGTTSTFSGQISGGGNITKSGAGTQVLSGTDTYTGVTTVTSGVLNLGANPGTSGILVRTLGAINISGGSLILPNAASRANRTLLIATGLTFAGSASSGWEGTFDLANNDMDVQNGNLSTITSQLAQGYNQGMWNGPGGIISSTAASKTTHLTALGAILNSATGQPGGPALYGVGTSLGLFDGTSPAASDVLVKYTYYGDANLSGIVDGSDYSRIDASFLAEQTGGISISGWYDGDFNYDGVIDGSDYTLIDNSFNQQGAALTAAVSTAQIASAAVPEPASLTLLAIAGSGLLARRRKSRPQ
jgi:autotransporter-associated beta strand protein